MSFDPSSFYTTSRGRPYEWCALVVTHFGFGLGIRPRFTWKIQRGLGFMIIDEVDDASWLSLTPS